MMFMDIIGQKFDEVWVSYTLLQYWKKRSKILHSVTSKSELSLSPPYNDFVTTSHTKNWHYFLGHSNLISCCSGSDRLNFLHFALENENLFLEILWCNSWSRDHRSLLIRRIYCEISKRGSWTNHNVQMTTITKSKSVSFSFLSRPTYPVLLLIFYLQQEIKLEWP